jgi:hypothetical protein
LTSNLSFDATQIDSLVKSYGLRQAWLNLLATKIAGSGKRFAYLLGDSAFQGAEIISSDLLAGLSIGEIGILYEYSVAHVDSNSRKDNGQFFTPDDVALLMVKQTVNFPKGTWLDPCSGIGNLSWHLINAQKDKERFLINQMILSDKDELALIIARTLFTLSFQKRHTHLFYEIKNCFVLLDFLSVSDSPAPELFGQGPLQKIPPHDFVIVNPPYLSLKGEDPRFETAKSRDLYSYFLENIIKTSKGFVSITPQSFTNAKKFEALRRLLLKSYPLLRIYAFDNIPGNIFYGVKFGSTNSNTANSIRAAITVAGPGADSKQITSLLRWRTSERAEMFSRLDEFLSSPPMSSEYFPKVSSKFIALYKNLLNSPTLDTIISPTPTKYFLYVPGAPRYFISALKKSVSRTSLKKLYFRTESDKNRAYLLINSSLMYWWWRVRDGGMTLSLETIKSLPMPNFEIDKKLISELERSEGTNLVYKMNAGALHENVKHDTELVLRVTEIILPKHAAQLILTHENSELVQIRRRSKSKVPGVAS